LGDDALTYEEYSNLSEIKQLEYLEKVAEILVKLIPNTNLSVGDELEIAIGPDMTAYYQIRGELDTNPDSAMNVEVIIEEQKAVLENFSVVFGKAEVVLGLDGTVGYRVEDEINQNMIVSRGVYYNNIDMSLAAELEVTTSVESSSVTSIVGVEKSKNANTGWESVPVVEPVPVVVLEEKEWWEEGWDFLCGIGETITDGVEDTIQWVGENKEVIEVVGYVGLVAIAAYFTGGASLAFSF